MANINAVKKKRNKSRAFKITVAVLFWFAVFFVINLIAMRMQESGITVNMTEAYVVLAISALISLLGFIATLYAIFFLERYSIKNKRRKERFH